MDENERVYERYMVFAFSDYYPSGGLSDCSFESGSPLAAIKVAEEECSDYVYVFDRRDGRVIWSKE